MQINNIDSSTNFGAIFKFTKTGDPACDIIEGALKASTVPAEAQKISKKFKSAEALYMSMFPMKTCKNY